jgi:spore coat protein A
VKRRWCALLSTLLAVTLVPALVSQVTGCNGNADNPLTAVDAAVALAAKPVPAGQVQLPGNKIAQFVDPLPLLSAAGGTMETIIAGAGEITLTMWEFQANMMPSTFVPANGQPYAGTWTFGYRSGTVAPAGAVDTPVGPVIVATRGVPTQIRYVNKLTSNNIFWRNWTDQSLHSAFHQIVGNPMPTPGDTNHYMGPVPAVPHLHGGEQPAVIDGGPEAYFLSDEVIPGYNNAFHGSAYYTHPGVAAAANEAVYRYPNAQEAAPLWFHDHLLGGTRLNATYAGLAGAYALIDPGTQPPGLLTVGLDVNGSGGVLPDAANEYLVPLVIQDRMFDTNGQLFFPNVGINPEHPYWLPEFVGDVIIVNGKVWPYLNVDRQRYRFYVINGSNSVAYDLWLQDLASGVKGPSMWVIATDGGYLDAPVEVNPNATGQQAMAGTQKSLTMMPGERYGIIVDFGDPAWLAAISAAYPGGVPNPLNLVLRNRGPTVEGTPKASLTGRIMQFRVTNVVPAGGDQSYNPATSVDPLRPANIVRLPGTPLGPAISATNVQLTRELTLNEVPGPGGPLEALVNNSKWNGLRPDMVTPIPGSTLVNGNWITELPNEGDTEIWEIVNLTADSHPIHLHAIQFQIVDREAFDTKAFNAVYNPLFPGGLFVGGYGPPLPYAPTDPGYDPVLQGGKYGGNPDVTPYLSGVKVPPLLYEQGWKDTAIMHPGEVTRIAVRWGPQDVPVGTADYFSFAPDAPATNGERGQYVWHCHITDHEDNEMMRPDVINPAPAAVRTYIQGVDY